MVKFFRNLVQGSKRPFYRDPFLRDRKMIFTWREIQCRALRICGRGGKGHLKNNGDRRWNRKGRWQ